MRLTKILHKNTSGHSAEPSGARAWCLLAVIAMAAILCACSGPSSPLGPAPLPTSEEYHLGGGDQVKVTIFGEQDLSGDYRVDGSGMLTMPLIGRVHAAGLTSDQLKATLQRHYKQYLKTPDVSVEIVNYRPFYIVGEVKDPGKYPYVNGMTVINAVAIAGGFTYRADSNDFYIQRKGKTKYEFSARQTTVVRPGDVVVVRERFF